MDLIHGSESSNQDVLERSAAFLIEKLMDGFNAALVLFGPTGSMHESYHVYILYQIALDIEHTGMHFSTY